VFETERCIVRDWRPDEAQRVFDLYSRWEVAKWLGATPRPLETLEEADRVISRWAELNAETPDYGRWAVERRADGVVAGTVLLVPIPDGDGEVEVGWHFHPDSWGQGLATEAARGALGWGFGTGLQEILAVVRPDNTPSLNVCRRLGMEELGRTERFYGTELELFRVRAEASVPTGSAEAR
jgi:RimJ/RimL family protein N-acetyltransferase